MSVGDTVIQSFRAGPIFTPLRRVSTVTQSFRAGLTDALSVALVELELLVSLVADAFALSGCGVLALRQLRAVRAELGAERGFCEWM